MWWVLYVSCVDKAAQISLTGWSIFPFFRYDNPET